MISAKQAELVVRNKKQLYQALIRNGYLLPPYKDAINTKKFLIGVKDERYWCLHSSQMLAVKHCADCPNKLVLAEMVTEQMAKLDNMTAEMKVTFKRTAKLIKKNPPGKDWMMMLLSTFNPNHEIFQRDYVQPAAIKYAPPE